jgi:hypothetical protein
MQNITKTLYLLIALVYPIATIAKNNCEEIASKVIPNSEVPWSIDLQSIKKARLCQHITKEQIDSATLDISITTTFEPAPSPSIPFNEWYDNGITSWMIGMNIAFLDDYGQVLFTVQKNLMAKPDQFGKQYLDFQLNLSKKKSFINKIFSVSIQANRNIFPPKQKSGYFACTDWMKPKDKQEYAENLCETLRSQLSGPFAQYKTCSCKEMFYPKKGCMSMQCEIEADEIVMDETPPNTNDLPFDCTSVVIDGHRVLHCENIHHQPRDADDECNIIIINGIEHMHCD